MSASSMEESGTRDGEEDKGRKNDKHGKYNEDTIAETMDSSSITKWLFGEENLTEDDIFGRRSSVSRSPPVQRNPDQFGFKPGESREGKPATSKHRRDGSVGDIYETIHIEDDNKEAPYHDGKKRKADTSPRSLKDEAGKAVSKPMKSLQKKVEDLVSFAAANKNVHKEVKSIATDLKRLLMQTMKEVALLQGRNNELSEALMRKQSEEKKGYKDTGCQTDLTKDKPELNLGNIHTFEEFAAKEDKAWEGHTFKHVALKAGNVLTEENQNITLICCEDRQSDDETTKNIIARFPEIWESERRCLT